MRASILRRTLLATVIIMMAFGSLKAQTQHFSSNCSLKGRIFWDGERYVCLVLAPVTHRSGETRSSIRHRLKEQKERAAAVELYIRLRTAANKYLEQHQQDLSQLVILKGNVQDICQKNDCENYSVRAEIGTMGIPELWELIKKNCNQNINPAADPHILDINYASRVREIRDALSVLAPVSVSRN